MKTCLLPFPTSSAARTLLCATALSGFLLPAGLIAATTSNGNFTVNATTGESGDLTVEGNLGVEGAVDFVNGIRFGSTLETPPASAVEFLYSEEGTDYELSLQTRRANTGFLWQDNSAGTIRPKMGLDASNVLSLYNPATGAATIALNPNTGRLSLTGVGSGIVLSDNTLIGSGADLQSKALYDNNGTARLSFDANGNLIVSAPASFQQEVTVGSGLNFGEGAVLDTNRVGQLQEVLHNLGYSESASDSWVSQFGVISPDGSLWIAKVAIAPSGNIWVAGTFSGKLIVQYQDGYAKEFNAVGTKDVFVAKLRGAEFPSEVGQFYQLHGTGEETVQDLVFEQQWETPCITGTFKGTVSNGSSVSSVGTTSDVYVAQMGLYGAWVRRIGTDGNDTVCSLGADAGNGIYVAGTFSTPLSYGGTSSLTSAGGSDGYLIKLNATNGTPVWAKAVGGSGTDTLSDMAVDRSNGGVCVTGLFSGSVSFGGAGNLASSGWQAVFLAKTDSGGNFTWAGKFSSAGSISSPVIACDSSGNTILAGSFSGTVSVVDSGNQTLQLTSGLDWEGSQNTEVFVSKINAAGAVQWFKQFGQDNNNYPVDVAVGSSGNAYITGQMVWWYSESGGNDPFLARVEGTTGDVHFSKYSTGSDSWITSVAAASNKMAFVTGFSDKKQLAGTLVPSGLALFVSGEGLPPESTASTVENFSWGNSQATAGAAAIGNQAYATSTGAFAAGRGTSSAQYSFSAGSGRAEGNYSTALGYGASAFGLGSVALGRGNASGENAMAWGSGQASGYAATASGSGSMATGSYSTAFGLGTKASGSSATAFGQGTLASGPYSFASGYQTKATGNGATALGILSEASGNSSTAFGGGKAQATAATAFGEYTFATGWGSTAWGNGTLASGEHATAIGKQTIASASASLVIGRLNIEEGSPAGWIETDPVFVIGNGWTDSGEDYNQDIRSNAFVVRKNGNVEMTGKVTMPRQGDILMGEFGNGD